MLGTGRMTGSAIASSSGNAMMPAISASSIHTGRTMNRRSRMFAAMFACFSTPGMFGENGVTRRSNSPSAVAPMKTTRSLTRSSPLPWSTSAAEMCGIVPCGPA